VNSDHDGIPRVISLDSCSKILTVGNHTAFTYYFSSGKSNWFNRHPISKCYCFAKSDLYYSLWLSWCHLYHNIWINIDSDM